MKRLAVFASTLVYLSTAGTTFAQTVVPTAVPGAGSGNRNIVITQPGGISPLTTLSQLLGNLLTIIFTVAILAVLFYIIWGAFNWITSGGDKEKINAARGRIINALIGLAVLALAFLIANVVGGILGINIFDLRLPPLGAPVNPTPAPGS